MPVPFPHLFEPMPFLLILIVVLFLAIPVNEPDTVRFTDFADDDLPHAE